MIVPLLVMVIWLAVNVDVPATAMPVPLAMESVPELWIVPVWPLDSDCEEVVVVLLLTVKLPAIAGVNVEKAAPIESAPMETKFFMRFLNT